MLGQLIEDVNSSHTISVNDAYAEANVATACQPDGNNPSGLRQIPWDNTRHLGLFLQQPQCFASCKHLMTEHAMLTG